MARAVWLGVCGCALALLGCSKPADDGGNSGTGGGAGGPSTVMSGGTGSTGATPGMMSGGTGSTGSSSSGMMGGTGSTGSVNPMSGGVGGMGSGMGGMGSGTGPGTGGGGPVTCATTNDIKTGAMCENSASGVFAIKTTIDTYWSGLVPNEAPIVDPGRGNLVIYLKGELTDVCPDGSGGRGIMKACGTELPAFRSDVTCDIYQIEFAVAIWDQPDMPTFETGGSTTGFNPGDTLTLASATGLVGIQLTAVDAAWPTPATTGTFSCGSSMGLDCFPDHDGDGKPGITTGFAKVGMQESATGCGLGGVNPWTFRAAPTSVDVLAAGGTGAGVRAKNVYVGLRTTLGGAGAIGADCESGVGKATVTAIESRAADCITNMGDAPCSVAQAQFVDAHVPNFIILNEGEKPPTTVTKPASQGGGPIDQTLSRGPRAQLVRLGDAGETFDCAAVRGASFPADPP